MSASSGSWDIAPPKTPALVWLLRLLILTGIGAALLALLLALMLLALQLALSDRIVPGVRVGDLELGGRTETEALAAIAERFAPLTGATITLRYGEHIWQARAADLGLRAATNDMLADALSIGHGHDEIEGLRGQAEAWFNGQNIAPQLTLDENVARKYLSTVAEQINRGRRDAGLSIVGTAVTIDSGQTGRALDIPASLDRLTASLLRGEDAEVELVVRESPARLWNVAEAALHVDAALSGPVQLVAIDPGGEPLQPWTITPAQIRALLSVTLTDLGDDKRYDVSINMEAFADFLHSLASSLMIVPAEGRFDFDPISQQLTAITPSSGGRELNVPETIANLEDAVFSRDARVVPMVFDYRPPRYHSGVTAAELGITELVAQATTYYWGSWQNRRDNIELGAGKLHGIIIAPGEEFSFNRHLGPITSAAGYQDSAVIVGGRTVNGIGGGICQVSTTMFRLAFSGGYAITERNSHGYRVGYYEYAGAGPGLDAAIWQPTSDFRFLNNTPHHLLIESEFMSAKDALQFRIYSTPHWRTVIETPIIRDVVEAPPPHFEENPNLLRGQIQQVDYAAAGADVWVYRNIYDTAGNLIKRDQAYTHYQPWQAVFEVAPGDPRLEVEEEDESE